MKLVSMTILSTMLALTARAEVPAPPQSPRTWNERMLTFALKGHDADEKPGDSAARFTYQRLSPLATFPEIVLHEVALVRTDAEARALDEMTMEPLLALARAPNAALVEHVLGLLELLDSETFELLRGTHGKLIADHFYVHPLSLRLLQWFPEAAAGPLFRPDVFLAQAAEIFTALFSDGSQVVLKGTYWTVLDAAIALQNAIVKRYHGGPGPGDHSLDRDRLTRAFTKMQLAIQGELIAQTRPIFRNDRLCALRLEVNGASNL